MEKIENLCFFRVRKCKSFLLKMKVTLFLALFCILQSFAGIYGQEARFDVALKDAGLTDLFKLIEKQGEFRFFYSIQDVHHVNGININMTDADIEVILDRSLRGTNLNYEITDKIIIIRKKEGRLYPQQPFDTIHGRVTDPTKEGLPGVTVLLKGTSLGTMTGKDGGYMLIIPKIDSPVLIFTFVGMKKKEMAWKGINPMNLTLEEDAQEVDEVVVTGYQTLREKGMAGSYSKIKAEDLIMTGNETIEQMLQGRLPGVMIINTSGLTGTRQKVRVRGTSTLVGNADPVWVVDGIIQEDNLPFSTSTLAGMGDIDDNLDMMKDFIGGAISWLNPNDIDEITVLKDASATAIYGVKAANGVILITTKKGEYGRMAINYSGNFSLSQRMNYKRQDVMNSKERVDLSNEAFKRGARVQDETIGYIGLALAYARRQITLEEFHSETDKLTVLNNNWFDLLYQTPFTQSHSISFSGGDHNTSYRASFGYRDVKNTAKGNEQTGYTGNLNISSIFWEKLTFNASVAGHYTETKAFASGVDPFNYAINTSRVVASHNENGELFYYNKNGYDYNILNELANSGNENTARGVNLNLSARWRITNDLALSATLGGATSTSFANTWFTERSHFIATKRGYNYNEYGVLDEQFKKSPLPYGGMLTVTESRNFNYTARLQAEYATVFNGLHAFNAMLGWEVRSNKYDGYSQTNWGYQPERGKSFIDVPIIVNPSNVNDDGSVEGGSLNATYARTKPTITDRLSNTVSYYATASYMYDNRYSINLSVRGDASNRFGESAKFEPIWSAGLRWNVTDERWLRENQWINNLSLTASLGYQGNVAENIGPDLIAKMEAVDVITGEFRLKWTQLPNPDLKWEKTMSVNLGAHFALLKSQLTGSFNWYYKKTTDVITKKEVPYENGTTSMYINDGNLTNKGWELSLNVVPVRTKNFMWSLGTSFSGNDNKVDSEVEPNGRWENAVNGTFNKKGYPVGSFWAFRFTGLSPEHGGPLFNFDGAAAVDGSEDATLFMEYMGTREPTFTLGINTVLRWKRFSIPLNFYISRGNYEFLASPYEEAFRMLSEFQNAPNELNKRWRKPGDESHTVIPSIPVGENCQPLYPFYNPDTRIYPLQAWQYSTVRVVNAWYIRFNDFQFSYNLPDKWVSRFADYVSVSFSATNPLQIKSKDFKGRDPEVALGQQPRSQNFSFGLSMSF